MEDIKVGEYVRTKKGYIAQINEIDKIDKYIWFNNKINKKSGIPLYLLSKVEFENLVTKHSKNIIDLIEIGDFVEIIADGQPLRCEVDEFDYKNKLKDIGEEIIVKSIVTKEQFDSIKYEV